MCIVRGSLNNYPIGTVKNRNPENSLYNKYRGVHASAIKGGQKVQQNKKKTLNRVLGCLIFGGGYMAHYGTVHTPTRTAFRKGIKLYAQ